MENETKTGARTPDEKLDPGIREELKDSVRDILDEAKTEAEPELIDDVPEGLGEFAEPGAEPDGALYGSDGSFTDEGVQGCQDWTDSRLGSAAGGTFADGEAAAGEPSATDGMEEDLYEGEVHPQDESAFGNMEDKIYQNTDYSLKDVMEEQSAERSPESGRGADAGRGREPRDFRDGEPLRRKNADSAAAGHGRETAADGREERKRYRRADEYEEVRPVRDSAEHRETGYRKTEPRREGRPAADQAEAEGTRERRKSARTAERDETGRMTERERRREKVPDRKVTETDERRLRREETDSGRKREQEKESRVRKERASKKERLSKDSGPEKRRMRREDGRQLKRYRRRAEAEEDAELFSYDNGMIDDLEDEPEEDYGEPVRKESRRERKRREQEEQEFREFQEYKRNRQKQKKKKKHKRLLIFLLILLLILSPFLWFLYKLGGMNEGISLHDVKNAISKEVQQDAQTGKMAGYTNIALFGVDSTNESLDSGNNRSDVMIIASISKLSGDVKLISVYRDTYLDIGNGNYQKANAAYAFGGPEQAVQMLNTNFDLNITDYVTIGFDGVASLIDAVGGVDIDVHEDEIEHLNNYQSTMAQELGMEYVPVTQAGTQTLTGLQATAYCRIRYTEGGDFQRTNRQKEVLTKAVDKLKKSGPVTMMNVANSMMSKIKTSLNPAEMAALAAQAFRFNVVEEGGVPTEDMRTVGYIGDQSCVIPITLSSNVTWLHEDLFGDTGYTPSQTVQAISSQISAVTGY